MPKRSIFIVVFCFFVFQIAKSQNYELGQVTKFELEQKTHPNDSSAVAAILFKKVKTTFKYSNDEGFVSYTDFSIKLKIYKKEGLSWANFEIPYYVGYEKLEDESIAITKAFTYNFEDGKITKDKVSSEGKFKEKVNEFWETKSVTFPNVKIGSIIELRYTLKTQNLSVLPDFQFQYKIPVDYAEYNSEIPEFYIYKAMISGGIEVQHEEVLENTSQSVDNKSQSSSYIYYKQIRTKYSVKDIPALIEEDYVNNIDNYYGKIYHELQIIRMPNEKPKQIATTWEDVVKSIYDEKEFGLELEKNQYYLEDLKRLTTGLSSDVEKMNVIFNYIKNKMSWNGKYGYYTKKPLEKAYIEHTGNAAEINLLLVSMLRMAGLKASPVLISTRENGIAFFPNRTRFNYVIVSVQFEGNNVLLDATNKYSAPNILPTRDLNWVGRLIEKDGTSVEINLTPNHNSLTINSLIANIGADGQVDGKIKKQYFDYNAHLFRDINIKLSNESYLEKVEQKHQGIEISDYVLYNKTELDKPVIESYSFRHKNMSEIIGDKLYFSPMLFFAETHNPFKQQSRRYPVDFLYPHQDKYLINLTIPEGYVVESLPPSVSIPMSSNNCQLKYIITNNDKQIQLSVTLDINTAIIPADNYEELKAFFAEIIKKETEKVVLKKV